MTYVMAQGLSRKPFPRSLRRVSTFLSFPCQETRRRWWALCTFSLAFFSLVRPHAIIIFTLVDHWSDRHLHRRTDEKKTAGFVGNIRAASPLWYILMKDSISKEKIEYRRWMRLFNAHFASHSPAPLLNLFLAQSKIYLFNKFSVFFFSHK